MTSQDLTPRSLAELEGDAPFATRHIGPRADEIDKMLAAVGRASLEELALEAVPEAIRATSALSLPAAATEAEALAELRALAARNRVTVPMLGLGYHGTHTPPVVLRNVLENPAWYTAYTPYQPEISQGRLEALLTFQTVVGDLTGLPTANASLLDEATAAAEALTLCRRQSKAPEGAVFVVDADCHPQTIAVVQTRATPLGLRVVVSDLSTGSLDDIDEDVFGVLVQYPGSSGAVRPLEPVVTWAHARGALVAVAADLLSLLLLQSPGDAGADVAVGTTQRFGVPLGYGGPHAGYMAVRSG
ncbi:MAG TPA: glycine dehydrogenase (aminomethyl-transferring), partial [Mycobacteriales bacterium]|nr:glycine dehydrogenase (aminomethyl-transferring) [Mycobacteriales bacterium]